MAHRVSILALTLVLAFPMITAAQAAPDQSDRERALQLFQESADHYRAGRFGVAAELLREAYDLHPEPLLLYNLGRALDGMGEFEEAIQAYRDYVEAVPDAEDRGAVERRIETLQTYLDAGSGGDAPPPPEGAPGATGPTYTDSGPSPVPFVIAGVGAAGVGIGVVLGLMAQSRHDDAVDENVHVTAAEKAEEADNLAAGANIAFVAGGILLAVGVAWGVLELTGGGGGEQESLSLDVGPGSVGLRGTF